MKKTILAALINSKKADIPCVQSVLGEYSGIVKTRLGIHDAVLDKRSQCAFLIIELAGTAKKQKEFEKELSRISGVSTKMISLKSK